MFHFLIFLPKKLARVTSGGRFIAEIDGLRFLAIFPVLIQHLSERLLAYTPLSFEGVEENFAAYAASRGFIGVYIFFVISGFVLALPFAAHHLRDAKAVSLKNYFWRRLTRLEPPYIILMTFFFLVLINMRSDSFQELFPHYLASIFYLHNIIYESYTPINPVAWSLEIEIQFYLLAPLLGTLLFRIKHKTGRRVVQVATILLILLAQQYFGWYISSMKMTILGNLHLFLIGFLLADIFLIEWKNGWSKSYGWDLLTLIMLPVPFFFWRHDFLNWMIFPFLLLIVFVGVFKSRYINRFFTNPWITAIGGMCYTIYLIHLPLAELMFRLTHQITLGQAYLPNLLLQMAIFLPVVFAVSILVFFALEKPCMDKHWPEKLRGNLRKALYRLKTY
ncbi:acyltransferase family protein [Nafulsella turpanensis]|uniref:acyltransferase family protein n=1 Tax=Nafulsella turpanensis TaxID=1265690 RepID=UPI00034A2E6D|nr:acyltransferase [Nafulsella turpanensis]